ncbi:unnamed protein product [Malus baccata var. baccata]
MKLFAGLIDGSRKIVSRVVLKQVKVFGLVHQAEELYMEDMKKPFTHHDCWEICKGWVLFQHPPQERLDHV